MCSQDQALRILAAVYQRCKQLYDGSIQDAILYGSYARGDCHGESDIDILLTARLSEAQIAEKRRQVAVLSSGLSLDYDVTVSVQVVPLTQFERYADCLPFYQNILREGIRYAS